MVMAQTPETAAQPGMPSSTIATGLVDKVLAPAKMPAALLAYAANRRARDTAPAVSRAASGNGLSAIFAVLRARTKYDFRGYKKGTLHRRIERRMGLLQIDSLAKYADYLRSHPAEADQLFKDLLIGVTSFFRDPHAFEELARKVLSGLVKERDPDGPIRVWVPGCSTGEEAYSLAIGDGSPFVISEREMRVLSSLEAALQVAHDMPALVDCRAEPCAGRVVENGVGKQDALDHPIGCCGFSDAVRAVRPS